ncbi:sugar ABC transporter substrate-binding protein [Lactococcus protaetiae]|uniref:Extracellular solute-binding protein n=1 Tax=Lactococcus protaetiae TaxID=2592653 RepID=A0A514Z832_9LACT|nr:extracellular solute-binding protein [Lactococcus protaetiae]MCL2113290.1 extracellular solute-binding protein [Streptococcaceae bacterium]QDK70667.1 extracellular solute-binding protein [Lactococcus protaetiae]
MKTWKKVTLTGVALMAAASLVACGNSSAKAGKSGSVKGQTLTVGYWKGSDTENATFDKLVKTFEKKYDVTVKPKVYTNITQQLPTDLSGGTAPDVFYIDSSFYPYLQKEGVLNKLSKSVANPSDFYKTSIGAFTTDGNVYAVPKDVSTLALYVNKDIFAKAGIDINSIPKSYEDFLKWAPAQQAKLDATYGKGKVYMMNMNADLTRNWQFITAGNQNPITKDGKGVSKLSNPTILKNLTFVQKMFNEGIVATPQQVGAGDEGTGFATGKFAMALTGNWNYQVYNTQYKDLHYTIIPNMTYDGQKQTMQYTVGWGEYKNTKVTSLANDWIKYVTGKDGMTTWTSGVGTLATRADVNDSSEFIKENPLLKVHSDELSYAQPWQDGVNLTTVVTSYDNFITNAFKKDATPAQLKSALKQADQDANSKLSK